LTFNYLFIVAFFGLFVTTLKLIDQKYAPKLESEKIGLKELVFLSEEKLQKLGIPMGPRTRIIQEINKLKPSNLYLV